MKSIELARRNFIEVWRDPVSLGITVALPVVLLLILQALEGVDSFYSPTNLVPGIVLFGFVMLMFSAAMTLSRDRDSALFARLLTTPLRSNEFVAAYSLPYLVVALLQTAVLFLIGSFIGMENNGNLLLLSLVLLLMALAYVGLGMLLGSLMSLGPLSGAYSVILLLTVFGGTWVDLEAIGGGFKTVGDALPFAHALYAARGVMIDGASLSDVASNVYWVLGYTVVLVALAVVVFRSRMQD